MQPAMVVAISYLHGGQAAVEGALLTYVAGPLLGAAALGLALRAFRLPLQSDFGVPGRLVQYQLEKVQPAKKLD
jgi:hypothetical protein